MPFAAASFDLVTSFDVIYSLPDEAERAAVAEMFRVLRPGGHLVINVAAMALLTGNHSVLSGEVRRYSRASLARALHDGGFEIRRISYTNATIMPMVTAVRLLQRVTGHKESTREISIPPRARQLRAGGPAPPRGGRPAAREHAVRKFPARTGPTAGYAGTLITSPNTNRS